MRDGLVLGKQLQKRRQRVRAAAAAADADTARELTKDAYRAT